MNVGEEIKRVVEQRAAARCEYCRMHQSLQGATFHVEHILPRSRGGHSTLDNLAWACPSCNLHKSDRIDMIDDRTGFLTTLFNPRGQNWQDHFAWDDLIVQPITDIGWVTSSVLYLNHPRRIRIREAERLFGLFPPDKDISKGIGDI